MAICGVKAITCRQRLPGDPARDLLQDLEADRNPNERGSPPSRGRLFAGERLSSTGSYGLKLSRKAFNHLHFLPVIGEFFAAIQAANISTCQSGHF